jgi:hypothetical protein
MLLTSEASGRSPGSPIQDARSVSTLFRTFPRHSRRSGSSRKTSRLTVAAPRRSYTGFPFVPSRAPESQILFSMNANCGGSRSVLHVLASSGNRLRTIPPGYVSPDRVELEDPSFLAVHTDVPLLGRCAPSYGGRRCGADTHGATLRIKARGFPGRLLGCADASICV